MRELSPDVLARRLRSASCALRCSWPHTWLPMEQASRLGTCADIQSYSLGVCMYGWKDG